MKYSFQYQWHFLLADCFPMAEAIDRRRDSAGRPFYDRDYEEQGWQEVTLPHTFNDVDLFRNRIQDAGSGQKRTCAFYRKRFRMPEGSAGSKALLEFEGIRQTCYLYVNGVLAGYYEAGVAPFGFDITPYIDYEGDNLIAVATDNTATRNIPFCIAETPNAPGAEPGSFLFPQDGEVPPEREGVGYFWNCNDFNPSLGGITRPVYLHVKKPVYLTLPLYSNLRTKGVYVYGRDFDLKDQSLRTAVSAEVRNESEREVQASLRVRIRELGGNCVCSFTSNPVTVPAVGRIAPERSIVPEDAYAAETLPDGKVHYVPRPEGEVAPTETASRAVTVLEALSERFRARLWSIEDPWLYRVSVELLVAGEPVDEETIETGFRKVDYDQNRGVLINGRAVWLTGYAQRASNEWAAAGIVPEWLHDRDAMWIRESGANHIRWMHVAASPMDIRSADRHGIVCTQPAGDKEAENFDRRWDQRVELMRDVIIAFRNHPSILFWEAGNNSINLEHMREMRRLKEALDPCGGRFMGCRTINTEDVVNESEYVGTMLNRHAARFEAEHGPVTETEYSREEAARRCWDDYTPPDYDFRGRYIGKGGRKQVGRDFWDLTMEDLILAEAAGYAEFFHDRIGGASGRNLYSAAAALCWTDSAQHGRQSWSENARMSGRVDAVRIRKQNFDLYRVMQSQEPAVRIIGHWNYPQDAQAYRYPVKRFNGEYWEETGEFALRDPHHKTVYVAASYPILRVELRINGKLRGSSAQPVNGFLFPFPDIDITQNGEIRAVGYDKDGNAAEDRLRTVEAPAQLRLTLHTSPAGHRADGADLAYLDVEVLDEAGDVCPLCDARIEFQTEGPAVFLGGYNSGRFVGNGRNDSVIHQSYVCAECGLNRVFLRSERTAGEIRVTAHTDGLEDVSVQWESVPVRQQALDCEPPVVWYADYAEQPPQLADDFPAIPEADALKYEAPKEHYVKVLLNGQEPDSRGVPTVNKNGSIWGNVLPLLERMKGGAWKEAFDFVYDREKGSLTVDSGGRHIEVRIGETHLLINGDESLMDGQPYLSERGDLVMEVNALLPQLAHTVCRYDDRIGALRADYTA